MESFQKRDRNRKKIEATVHMAGIMVLMVVMVLVIVLRVATV